MNLKNKLFAGFTALSMFVSVIAPISAITVKADSAEDMSMYEWAFDTGMTTKTSFADFMFENAITREQAAKFLVKGAEALELTTAAVQSCDYTDLANADVTLISSINDACEMGIFKAQANFNPLQLLTREQAELTVARIVYGYDEVANYAADSDISDFAAARELLMADDIVKVNVPSQSAVRRGHLGLMLYRLADADITEPGTGNPVLPGHAEVSLVSNAGTQSVAQNSVRKIVGTIKLTAGTNPTTVSSVVVARSGLGSNDVEIQLGNAAMVTDARKVNSNNEAVVRFSPALKLAAGESQTFNVMASFVAPYQANASHTFKVVAVNVANGSASGTPVTLGTLNTTSYSVGTVTASNLVASSVKAGETNKKVLSIDLSPNKDAIINGFIITKDSGEDFTKAFDNIKAYYNGAVIGSVNMTAEKIIVSGLNIQKDSSDSANIELKADGIFIGSASTIDVKIQSESDIHAVEKTTNENMQGSITAGTQTINLSGIKLTVDKTTTKDETVAPGTANVTLFEAKVKSDVEFDISDYTLKLASTYTSQLTGNVNANEVILYVDGVRYDIANADLALLDAAAGLNFNKAGDRFTVTPTHDVNVKLVASFTNGAAIAANYKYELVLNKGRNISNGQEMNLTVSAVGNAVKVSYGTYNVSKPTIAPNKTIEEGTTSDILNFDLRASSENQIVQEVTITSATGFDVYADKIALYDGTSLVKEFTSSTELSGTTLLFDDLSVNLDKDMKKSFSVKATLKGGDVTTLGTNVDVKLTVVKVARAKNTAQVTSGNGTLPLSNRVYQVSSKTPLVILSNQVLKNTNISFDNASNYDVYIESVKAEITQNQSSNGNYVNWGGTANFLDAIGGSIIVTGTSTLPGAETFNFTSNLILGAGERSYAIELIDAAHTITADDYTINIKEVKFHYVDRDDNTNVSPSITETYNGVAL